MSGLWTLKPYSSPQKGWKPDEGQLVLGFLTYDS